MGAKPSRRALQSTFITPKKKEICGGKVSKLSRCIGSTTYLVAQADSLPAEPTTKNKRRQLLLDLLSS